MQARLGAGGMGEVYRARDTKLGRDVAIKILPHVFTSDPERLARFEREARMLAALNHPNIGAIYGLEDADGIRALVLELVDGETLADRIARGPLPLKDALPMARQIAEALDAAHDKGIVHRDLKPRNVALTRDGTVKVLDFGLAKAIVRDGAAGEGSHAPTMTIGGTREGMVLGTAAYMSPEQARGQAVDKRTDIWAFGCVLYEMLTRQVAFSGETISDTIAAVLEREPSWAALPAATPPNIRRLLQRCLEKDPRRRWRDIGDVRIELDDAEVMQVPRDGVEHRVSRGRERAAWAALVLVTAAAATLVTPALREADAPPEVRFDVSFPRDISPDFVQLAISPDGQQLVTAPNFGGAARAAPLWLRPLGSTSGRTLPGTEGAGFPFWSPDGESIGFFADGKLKRVDVDSQAIEIVADGPVPRGGAWQADGTILFAPNAIGPLFRVPATGGQPTVATHLEKGQSDHRAPFILPDGRHFLYYARGDPQVRGVHVARLDGSESRRLLAADAAAVYAASWANSSPCRTNRRWPAAEAFSPALERLARAYERDPDKYRDLLQEIHVALWRSLARFDGRCSLRTWVYRVAHNTAISKTLRPRTRAPTLVALDDSLESLAALNSEEQALDRRRTLERLHELIRQLKPLDRQVMLLYLEQLDASSIAEITGLSAANVSTKVRRIKQLLIQRFYEGKGDGE